MCSLTAKHAASVSTTPWRRPVLTLTAMPIRRLFGSNYAKPATLSRRAAGTQRTRADTMCSDVRRPSGHLGVVAKLAARLPTFVADRRMYRPRRRATR
jgi:hypothetical protein